MDIEMAKPSPPPTLSNKQILLCNMMSDPEQRMLNKTDMATKLGVSRPTLYKYLDRKDVQDYIKELVNFYTDGEIGNIWKAHIRECKRGNIQAIKLFYEMKQMYVPPQQVIDLKTKDATATINIISNIPRPKIDPGEKD